MPEGGGPSVLPIDSLPYDVLRQVVITCYMDLISSNSQNPVYISVVLSRLNRFWRHIALSIPQLWSSIYINKGLGEDPNSLLQRTKACLDRSRDSPLFISIQLQPDLEQQEQSMFNDVVRQLIPHSDRWHSMSIQAPLATHRILSQAKSHMKTLVNLHCRVVGDSKDIFRRQKATWTLRNAYESAPSLRGVYLPSPLTICFPWERLETWIGTLGEYQLRDLYVRAQNLSTLVLRGFVLVTRWESFRLEVPSGVTVLPNLTSLSLTVNGPGYHLLCTHVVPESLNLQRFSLIFIRIDPLGPLLDWISRLPPTLSMFSLIGQIDLQPTEATEILNALPQSNITHLRISLPALHHSVDILTDLVGGSARSVQSDGSPAETNLENHVDPFPRLEYLDVVQGSNITPIWTQFLEEGCLKSPSQLRAVYLSYPGVGSAPDKKTMTALKALQDRGIAFKIEPWGFGEYTVTLKELMRQVRWDSQLEGTIRTSPWSCGLTSS